MHALQWIDRHGRYLRKVSSHFLRQKLNRAKRQCTWCGQQLGGRKRTWCGMPCVDAFHRHCCPRSARSAVFDRDHGVCVSCGLDTEWLTRLMRLCQPDQRRRRELCTWRGKTNRRGRRNLRRQQRRGRVYCVIRNWLRRRGFDPRQALWELDHILPVCRGGGLCGLENYQTLCQVCHVRKGAEDLRPRRRVR